MHDDRPAVHADDSIDMPVDAAVDWSAARSSDEPRFCTHRRIVRDFRSGHDRRDAKARQKIETRSGDVEARPECAPIGFRQHRVHRFTGDNLPQRFRSVRQRAVPARDAFEPIHRRLVRRQDRRRELVGGSADRNQPAGSVVAGPQFRSEPPDERRPRKRKSLLTRRKFRIDPAGIGDELGRRQAKDHHDGDRARVAAISIWAAIEEPSPDPRRRG